MDGAFVPYVQLRQRRLNGLIGKGAMDMKKNAKKKESWLDYISYLFLPFDCVE